MNDNQPDYETLVPHLRDDLSLTNRQNGSGLSHMIEVTSESSFFTIGSEEYRYICYLDGKTTLRQAWESYRREKKHLNQSDDVNTLGWEQAIQVFKFLHSQKLIGEINEKAVSLDRDPNEKPRIQNVNPYGFRLKLFDADTLANRLSQRLGWAFGWTAFFVWLFAVLWAAMLIVGNSASILDDTKVVLQPENWIWLTLCWAFLKVIHESSHAICCKRFGGQVGEAGINFLLLLPMPYVDVTSSWKFDSKWKRIGVALAGIYAELFVASLFVMVWAYSHNPILDSIAVQMLLMASLSTVLFNINPLMRFDGYFVLSDLVKRPNLATNGSIYLKTRLKQLLFGIVPPNGQKHFDRTTRIYGWLAAAWKIIIAVGLLIAAAKLFYGAGIILAALAIFVWYIKPLFQSIVSMFSANSPDKVSRSRCLATLAAFSLLFWSSTWIPWPFAPSAHGVVDYADKHIVRAPSNGFLIKNLVRHGQHVKKGDALVEIENRDLDFNLRSLLIDRDLAVVEYRKLKREKKIADCQAVAQKIGKLDEQIGILRQQSAKLTLRATHPGFVVASDLENLEGTFFKQGDEILKVVSDRSLEVVSCVNEFNVEPFRNALHRRVSVQFESGHSLASHVKLVEPTAVQEVFHSALSAENGGPLAVQVKESEENSQEMELTKPVFKATTFSLPVEHELTGKLKVGQRCKVHLSEHNRSCFDAIRYQLFNWLREHWYTKS